MVCIECGSGRTPDERRGLRESEGGNSIGTMCEFVDDARFDSPATATSV